MRWVEYGCWLLLLCMGFGQAKPTIEWGLLCAHSTSTRTFIIDFKTLTLIYCVCSFLLVFFCFVCRFVSFEKWYMDGTHVSRTVYIVWYLILRIFGLLKFCLFVLLVCGKWFHIWLICWILTYFFLCLYINCQIIEMLFHLYCQIYGKIQNKIAPFNIFVQ